MSNHPRVRIAPSPTGNLHIGTARTALFNFLFAKHSGGSLILRIEDTDTGRSTKEFERDIEDGLNWLSITPDEGPKQGGKFGPYLQSERSELYADAADQLVESGKAYPCFCTPEELEEGRRKAQTEGKAYIYPGTCRHLSKEEVEEKRSQGLKSVLRFAVPHDRQITIRDLVKGSVDFNSSLIGDFVIQRADGVPLYSLANVVDDSAMEISHVLRGEDLLPSTPNQIMLYEALGKKPPQFGHLPLLLNPDRTKLSKRKGATSVSEFKREGYLPDALVNFIAFLGWSPGTEEEIFSLAKLGEVFTLDRVQKGGAVFDENRLRYLNAQYLKRLDDNLLLDKLNEWLPLSDSAEGKRLLEDWRPNYNTLRRAVPIAKERAELLADLVGPLILFTSPPQEFSVQTLKESSKDFSRLEESAQYELLNGFSEKITEASEGDFASSETVAERLIEPFLASHPKATRPMLLAPVRVALTGLKQSPGVDQMLAVFGKEESITRLQDAAAKLKS